MTDDVVWLAVTREDGTRLTVEGREAWALFHLIGRGLLGVTLSTAQPRDGATISSSSEHAGSTSGPSAKAMEAPTPGITADTCCTTASSSRTSGGQHRLELPILSCGWPLADSGESCGRGSCPGRYHPSRNC